MIWAWLFILTPLTLFLAGFVMEAYLAFRRLGTKSDSGYVDATWELTHTLLVVAVAMFVSLFSGNLIEIAKAAFPGMFLTATFVGVRTACYIYTFYIKSPSKQLHRTLVDYVYAWSHAGIVLGLVLLLVRLVPKLFDLNLTVNTQFLPYMWPGLIVILAVGLMPAMSLYRTKR